MNRILLLFTAFAIFLVTGCGGGGEASETPDSSASEAEAPQAEVQSSSEDGMTEIVIQPVGDQLKFALEEFTVPAGASVRLIMDNVATLEAMQHNVVILKPGTDINTVGVAAMQAGPDNEYVPQGDENILFYTGLAKPGEKTMVEFTAPTTPGEYPFICTFPGHYSLMKGIMVVE